MPIFVAVGRGVDGAETLAFGESEEKTEFKTGGDEVGKRIEAEPAGGDSEKGANAKGSGVLACEEGVTKMKDMGVTVRRRVIVMVGLED